MTVEELEIILSNIADKTTEVRVYDLNTRSILNIFAIDTFKDSLTTLDIEVWRDKE